MLRKQRITLTLTMIMIQCTSYISSFHTTFWMEKGSQPPLIIIIYMHALLQCTKYYGSSQNSILILLLLVIAPSLKEMLFYNLDIYCLSGISVFSNIVHITSIWRLASLMIFLPWPFPFVFQIEALALIFFDIGDLNSASSAASVA